MKAEKQPLALWFLAEAELTTLKMLSKSHYSLADQGSKLGDTGLCTIKSLHPPTSAGSESQSGRSPDPGSSGTYKATLL